MFKRILLLILYRIGIYKLKNIEDKIKFIKRFNFDLYDTVFGKTRIYSVCDDITKYIDELKNINNNEKIKEYITVRNITTQTPRQLYINQWMSYDGRIVTDTVDIFKMWLTEVNELNNFYILHHNDMTNAIPYSNSRKIKPYIINIEHILDCILDTITQ